MIVDGRIFSGLVKEMKSILILLIMVSISIAGFSGVPNDQQKAPAYIEAYKEFLLGGREAEWEDEWRSITGADMYYGTAKYFAYALFDMNGDDIPELHIHDHQTYAIFTFQDSEVSLWHYTSAYFWPTNDGALLYTREGAGPPHVTYQYEKLDFWGQPAFHVDFSEGDVNYDGVYDDFIYEGKRVTKEEWNALTEEYLSAPQDLIEWFPLSDGVSHIQ